MSTSVNQEEKQYLDLLKDNLKNGVVSKDRKATGTKNFGRILKFNLFVSNFRFLTSKKNFYKRGFRYSAENIVIANRS